MTLTKKIFGSIFIVVCIIIIAGAAWWIKTNCFTSDIAPLKEIPKTDISFSPLPKVEIPDIAVPTIEISDQDFFN